MRHIARSYDLGPAQLYEQLFIARATLGTTHTGWPINRQVAWQQRGLKATTGEFEVVLPMNSGPSAEVPVFPATYLCPPACMLMSAQPDETGNPLFAYQPTVHVMGGRITQVNGATNATYTVENLDAALKATTVTPLDRWPTINYQPKAVNSFVLLLCTDADNLRLIAFESPVITACPAGASAPSISALNIAGL